MQVSIENKTAYTALRCYLNKDNEHFLDNPRFLPCENLACYQCIRNQIEIANSFECSLCNEQHEIHNIEELKVANSFIDKINTEDLIKEIENMISENVSEIEDTFKKKSSIIEKICEDVKLEISNRIEIVKGQLDALQIEMRQSLEEIKNKTRHELILINTEAKDLINSSESATKNLEEMLENFTENREKIETSMYECQHYINDLLNMEEKFRLILRKVIFEPSEWKADEKFIFPNIDKFEISNN